jgi:hypothetical protein
MIYKTMAVIFCLLSLKAFATLPASEKGYKCTEWTAQSGISCIFAGNNADVFERQCENPCWNSPRTRTGNWGPNCDKERVCSLKNPSSFSGVCSKWVRQRSVTCRNPNTNRWEDSWKRVCTVGLKESWCSDANPNNL